MAPATSTRSAPSVLAERADLSRLVDEWDVERNGDLTPRDVYPSSTTRVWWICRDCEHSWQAAVNSRAARGAGCRPCYHRRLSTPGPGESLGDLFPHLVPDWAPSNDRSPFDVKPRSTHRADWVCSTCSHGWTAEVGSRAAGCGCPACAKERQRRPKPGESLAEKRPDLLADWDHERNGGVDPRDVRVGSATKYHWLCAACGHRWQRDVYSRAVRGIGCNACADEARRRPKPGDSLAEKRPDLAAEWDHERNGTLTPYDVTPGTGRTKAHWICADGHRWSATPNQRTNRGRRGNEHGCPECARVRTRTPEPGRSFGDLYPRLAAQVAPGQDFDPYCVKPFCDERIAWVCSSGHRWGSKVGNRTLGNGCPRCKPVGWSMWEVRVRTELQSCGLPVVFPHPRIEVSGRGPVACDVVLPALGLVIECDGYGGHRWAESVEADRSQTAALSAAGWKVLRVRQGLGPSGSGDICVPRKAKVKEVVQAILECLAELGMDVPVERYRTTGPWAVDEAERLIAAYLRDGYPSHD